MRKRHLWLIAVALVVLVAALVLASCGSSTTSTTKAPATTTTAAAATTTEAGGAVDAAALFAANCAGCHESTPGGSLDDVKAAIDKGKGSSMPAFADKLTAAEIAALAAWVANGGK